MMPIIIPSNREVTLGYGWQACWRSAIISHWYLKLVTFKQNSVEVWDCVYFTALNVAQQDMTTSILSIFLNTLRWIAIPDMYSKAPPYIPLHSLISVPKKVHGEQPVYQQIQQEHANFKAKTESEGM